MYLAGNHNKIKVLQILDRSKIIKPCVEEDVPEMFLLATIIQSTVQYVTVKQKDLERILNIYAIIVELKVRIPD